MDDEQGRSSKHGTKKAQITIQPGAQNIGGLVVIGASLAIAGLVGTFFFNKTKRRQLKKSERPLKGDEDEGIKGVLSILQTSSEPTCHESRCCSSCEMVSTQMDSSELVSSKSVIMEENLKPKINGSNENSSCDHQNILILDGTNTSQAPGVLEDACGGLNLPPLTELDTFSMTETETNHENEGSSGEQSTMKEDFEVKMDQKMENNSALKENFEVETDHKMDGNSHENSAIKGVLEDVCDIPKLSLLPESNTLSMAETETHHKTESNSGEHSAVKEDFEVKMDRKMENNSALKENFEVETDHKMDSNSHENSASKGVLEDVCDIPKLSLLPESNTLSMAETETHHKTESNSGEHSTVKEDLEVKMDGKMESGSQEDSVLKDDFKIETHHKMDSDSQENFAMKGVLEDVCDGPKLSLLPELDTLSMAKTETNDKKENSSVKEDFELEMNWKMKSGSQEDLASKEDFEAETNHKMDSNSQENSAMKEDFEAEMDHKMASDSLQEHSAFDEDFENKTCQEEEDDYDHGELVAAEKASLEKTASLHPLHEGDLEEGDGYADNEERQEISNEEYIIETLEGRSEGTRSSSAESNSEAIWPAESLARDDTMENQQNQEEKIVQIDTTTKMEKSHHINNDKSDILQHGGNDCKAMEDPEFVGKGRISETAGVKDQLDNGVNNRNWIWSFLAPMLCRYCHLPVTTICLTVLLVVVISLYYDKV